MLPGSPLERTIALRFPQMASRGSPGSSAIPSDSRWHLSRAGVSPDFPVERRNRVPKYPFALSVLYISVPSIDQAKPLEIERSVSIKLRVPSYSSRAVS